MARPDLADASLGSGFLASGLLIGGYALLAWAFGSDRPGAFRIPAWLYLAGLRVLIGLVKAHGISTIVGADLVTTVGISCAVVWCLTSEPYPTGPMTERLVLLLVAYASLMMLAVVYYTLSSGHVRRNTTITCHLLVSTLSSLTLIAVDLTRSFYV
jgi:hypothetical protein